MRKKDSSITVTDQFCGAGGSSQGARKVLENRGGHVAVALNHWDLAIETHNTNFPETMHDCTDISACDPRRYPSTTILITSPECTNHSLAKGQKAVKAQLDLFSKGVLDPASERSRATMWDVPRFAEYHKYEAIIVENVVDARKWVQFPAWLHAMHLLGYKHKCVYLNSMHAHPTPQSRDRMYVVFWKKGNKDPDLEIRPSAFSPKIGKDVEAFQWWKNSQKKFGKYKQQYLYRCPITGDVVEPYYHAAYNAIDWSDIGKRIGDRKKPLSPNTLRRIKHGLEKYGKEPFQVINFTPGTSKSIFDPIQTCTTIDHNALALPFLMNEQHSTGVDCRVKSVTDPFTTFATQNHMKLVVPFVIKGEHTLQDGYARSVKEAFQTQTVRQSMALVTPWIIEMNSSGEAKPATYPTSTFTSGGVNHGMLQVPFIVENKGQSNSKSVTDPAGTLTTHPHLGICNSFIQSYYGQETLGHISDAIGTVTTKDRHSLVSFAEPKIEDCYYRMLKPHEIKAAMAFEREYVVLGNSKQQVKQLGNAVTPPAMELLVDRIVTSLS